LEWISDVISKKIYSAIKFYLAVYFSLLLITKYYPGDQIKNNDMGWTCGTSGTGEVHMGFRRGNVNETDHLEDLVVDGRTILEWILQDSVGSA
jgi:hypothetical protein